MADETVLVEQETVVEPLVEQGDDTHGVIVLNEGPPGPPGEAGATTIPGIAGLQDALDDLLAADSAEAATRAAADTSEATSRASADATESAARIAGDATNATAITTEATARAAAVTAEASARSSADTSEASTRASADSAEASARAAADSALDTRATALEATAPTAGQKAALAGTSGTPGSGNKYVTDGDARNTNSRTPTSHSHPISDVTGLQTALDAAVAAEAALDSRVDVIETVVPSELDDHETRLTDAEAAIADLEAAVAPEASATTTGTVKTNTTATHPVVYRVSEVDALIASEASSRSAADSSEASTRASADSSEASTRASADTALDGRATALEATAPTSGQKAALAGTGTPSGANKYVTNDSLTSEASTRAAADTTLQSNIDAEAATRASADSSEATTRAAADALLAPLASPALTGNPTVPTQSPGTNNTRASSTAYADAAVAVEATARASADTTLGAADTTEAAARVSGDSDLSSRLTALESGSTTPAGTFLVSGGNVAFVSGLTYRVGAAVYYIAGTRYTSSETNVTLDAADASLDRIDVIALDATGPVKVSGTAATNPLEPSLDPSVDVRLTAVYLAATVTSAPVTSTPIYTEGSEWTTTPSGSTIVKDSTTNPRTGTKCVKGTAVAAGDYCDFVTAAFDPAAQNNVILYVRPESAAWNTHKAITLTWYNGTTQKGVTVTVGNAAYGFNSQVTGAYQQVVVPVSAFSIPSGQTVTKLRIGITGTGGSVNFEWDDIQLQAGVSQAQQQNAMVFKGVYSAAVAYVKNDVVTEIGGLWIASGPSTNKAPESNSSLWTLVMPGALQSKSADYTALVTDRYILMSASGAARTVTLPAAAGNSGLSYQIKKTDSTVNTVTVDGNASETIDGQLTYVLSVQYESVTLVCDGSNWFVL